MSVPVRTTPLPASLRNAGVLAVTILFLAGALLYQENVRSEAPPDFSRGGAFAGDLAQPGDGEITVATPVPRPTPSDSRSTATLRAPRSIEDVQGASGVPFPTLGRYVYTVQGTESASLFGSRAYPPEMTMTVHRDQDGTGEPKLQEDEVAFDLNFSQDHEEREIVAYRKKGIAFTFEAGSVTFGPRTQTSEATYVPPMTQIPIPLTESAAVEGTSRAISPDGTQSRIEDWSVRVEGREQISIMGIDVDTYVVEITRQTQPGSSESVTRSRKYWLDPVRAIWVKWEEHMSGSQNVGLGSFTYTTNFIATLDRIEPL